MTKRVLLTLTVTILCLGLLGGVSSASINGDITMNRATLHGAKLTR